MIRDDPGSIDPIGDITWEGELEPGKGNVTLTGGTFEVCVCVYEEEKKIPPPRQTAADRSRFGFSSPRRTLSSKPRT